MVLQLGCVLLELDWVVLQPLQLPRIKSVRLPAPASIYPSSHKGKRGKEASVEIERGCLYVLRRLDSCKTSSEALGNKPRAPTPDVPNAPDLSGCCRAVGQDW